MGKRGHFTSLFLTVNMYHLYCLLMSYSNICNLQVMWVTITKFGEFRHAKPQNNWALHYKLLPFCTWIRHHLCKPRTRLQVCKWKPQSSRRWKKVLKFPTSPISCSERTLNTQPQSAWPWPVPSIQIHSCVGGSQGWNHRLRAWDPTGTTVD